MDGVDGFHENRTKEEKSEGFRKPRKWTGRCSCPKPCRLAVRSILFYSQRQDAVNVCAEMMDHG